MSTKPLTPAQVAAVTALIGGATHSEAAQIAGVSRETVSRWCTKHPGVKTALNEAHSAIFIEHILALTKIRTAALDIAQTVLANLRTALPEKQTDQLALIRAVTPLLSMPAPPTRTAKPF